MNDVGFTNKSRMLDIHSAKIQLKRNKNKVLIYIYIGQWVYKRVFYILIDIGFIIMRRQRGENETDSLVIMYDNIGYRFCLHGIRCFLSSERGKLWKFERRRNCLSSRSVEKWISRHQMIAVEQWSRSSSPRNTKVARSIPPASNRNTACK